jgi:dTDP-4-dehydrorhamnose 3,5-epimerase
MEIISTPISGLSIVKTNPVRDQRGAFYRAFCNDDLEPLLQGRIIRQANVSRTQAIGAIRGMHFQHSPHAEMKLIRCLSGRVWDVALDLRAGSPTFLQWYGAEISSENAHMMVIPEGCAHGFQVLEPDSELLYLHTASYEPSAEGGVLYNDPSVNIEWKIPPTDMSKRDTSHLLLSSSFKGLVL